MSKERFSDDPTSTIYKTSRVEDITTLRLFVKRIPDGDERKRADDALNDMDITTVHEILAEAKVLIIRV